MTVSNSTEYITIGKFTVSKIKSSTYESNITAVGFISSKLAVDLPTISTLSIPAIVDAIASTTGLTISLSGVTSAGTITTPLTSMTCRAALELVTFLLGAYATETADGNIRISKYQIPSSKLAVNGDRMLSFPKFSEIAFTMTGVKVLVAEESYDDEGELIPEVSYSTSTTVRQMYENKYMTQALFNTFAANVVGYTYMPGEVDLSLGDPRLEPWDCLAVTDTNNTTYNVPCLQIVHEFDGGLSTTVTAAGEATSDVPVEGYITKQLGQVNSELIKAQDGAAKAAQAADAAQTAAGQAERAAGQANELLGEMRQSAEEAGTTLTQIYSDAESAKVSAEAARRSASGAQYSLSELEQVMGALNWISEHATYEITSDNDAISGKFYFNVASASLTTDTTIDKTKAYYTLSGGVYTYVENPVVADIGTYYEVIFGNVTPQVNPSLQGYYELSSSTFALSADTSVVDGKTYYIKNTSGGQTWYKPVINPTGDPSDEGWYELTSATYVLSSDTSVQENKLYFTYDSDTSRYIVITEYEANPALLGLYELGDVEESISNYIASHVSLDNDGLVIQTDDIDTKVRVSGKGVQLTNELGVVIATFSEDVRLGHADGTHITLSPVNGLGFYQGTEDENDPSVNRVAYINYDTLFINQAEIVSNLRIGDFVWKVQTNRISLVYAP